jgi:hypothetical protein
VLATIVDEVLENMHTISPSSLCGALWRIMAHSKLFVFHFFGHECESLPGSRQLCQASAPKGGHSYGIFHCTSVAQILQKLTGLKNRSECYLELSWT